VNTVSLGVMARDQNIVTDGRVGMQELARVVLHEHMSKDPNVRCSDWSIADLQSANAFSTSQRVYAAMDVIVTLKKVFAAGLKVPYFTRGAEKRGLTLGALAEVHAEEFAVLLSARNLSEHLHFDENGQSSLV
jgi:hypothetical protein